MPAKKRITRQLILDTALELLRRGGAANVNVNVLAKALGCSTQPIYLSFSGMDELRRSLVDTAAEYFIGKMEEYGGKTLYDAAYLRLALEEKELFRFLFMRRGAFEEVRESLRPMTEGAISALMLLYGIDRERAHYLHDQLWMQAHGIASMMAAEFCDWDFDRAKSILDSSCRAILAECEAKK